MQFTSSLYIFFLILVVFFYYRFKSAQTRKSLLLIASYVFYAAWDPRFLGLIFLSTCIDFISGRGIAGSATRQRKQWFLLLSIISNLMILFTFKYFHFFVDSFITLASLFGISVAPTTMNIILPVGLSFYTFSSLSFTIDMYKNRLKMPSLLDFSLFISFFPQLIAGPIVRAAHFLPQLDRLAEFDSRNLRAGGMLILVGLFKKVVVSSYFAAASDSYFGNAASLGTLEVLCAATFFGMQIYFDFSAYSDIAIGSARILGFDLPVNFRAPYGATSFSDFWKRWHISLSSWMRDYLYIPLGGNRRGQLLTYRNIMITMLLGGLWHGAMWTFVAWGALHGLYLTANRAIKNKLGNTSLPNPVLFGTSILVFFLISITWIFFRAPNFDIAFTMIHKLFQFQGLADTSTLAKLFGVILLGPVASYFRLYEKFITICERRPNVELASYTLMVLSIFVVLVTLNEKPATFIYFQF
jgi:D-alanyl-lipoteichoic acid acyltransferase DltB (MBOAT superfamily)